MKRRRVYLSHPIRGRLGLDADERTISENCNKAVVAGTIISCCVPEIDLYVPAQHDEFVQIAYDKGFLTETEILDIDCTIISKCDLLLVYNWQGYISRGMMREMEYAREHGIPIITFCDVTDIVIEAIKKLITLEIGAENG